MGVLLAVWAVVGLGGGILFADQLNGFHIGGFPLGFWIAQQGSIMVFVLLILVYAFMMNRLDAAYVRRARGAAMRKDEARVGESDSGSDERGTRS